MIRPSALSRRLAGTALLCVAALSVATAAAAQRGTQSGPPRAGRPDTARAPQAFALDFQNQELSVVLSALAEAGNLNVAMSNIPAQRVTVRMARGVPRDTLVAIIRGLAAANSVTFTEQGGLIRLEGDPAMSSANLTAANQAAVAAAQAQAAQANQLRLYTYRLRHASASEVAPVLMNLLGLGTGIVGGQGFIPGQPIQITVPGAGGAAGGRGGGAGAAGGGG
ncbi:MAG: hypothetical protein FJ202_13830, partial [Gemmatimonadetes bacterium]|nr:hypothetical protein [Gemmatimonadota bacterium]